MTLVSLAILVPLTHASNFTFSCLSKELARLDRNYEDLSFEERLATTDGLIPLEQSVEFRAALTADLIAEGIRLRSKAQEFWGQLSGPEKEKIKEQFKGVKNLKDLQAIASSPSKLGELLTSNRFMGMCFIGSTVCGFMMAQFMRGPVYHPGAHLLNSLIFGSAMGSGIGYGIFSIVYKLGEQLNRNSTSTHLSIVTNEPFWAQLSERGITVPKAHRERWIKSALHFLTEVDAKPATPEELVFHIQHLHHQIDLLLIATSNPSLHKTLEAMKTRLPSIPRWGFRRNAKWLEQNLPILEGSKTALKVLISKLNLGNILTEAGNDFLNHQFGELEETKFQTGLEPIDYRTSYYLREIDPYLASRGIADTIKKIRAKGGVVQISIAVEQVLSPSSASPLGLYKIRAKHQVVDGAGNPLADSVTVEMSHAQAANSEMDVLHAAKEWAPGLGHKLHEASITLLLRMKSPQQSESSVTAPPATALPVSAPLAPLSPESAIDPAPAVRQDKTPPREPMRMGQ